MCKLRARCHSLLAPIFAARRMFAADDVEPGARVRAACGARSLAASQRPRGTPSAGKTAALDGARCRRGALDRRALAGRHTAANNLAGGIALTHDHFSLAGRDAVADHFARCVARTNYACTLTSPVTSASDLARSARRTHSRGLTCCRRKTVSGQTAETLGIHHVGRRRVWAWLSTSHRAHAAVATSRASGGARLGHCGAGLGGGCRTIVTRRARIAAPFGRAAVWSWTAQPAHARVERDVGGLAFESHFSSARRKCAGGEKQAERPCPETRIWHLTPGAWCSVDAEDVLHATFYLSAPPENTEAPIAYSMDVKADVYGSDQTAFDPNRDPPAYSES
jgi:hypothetical protein